VVGDAIVSRLTDRFTSQESLAIASLSELTEIPNITPELSVRIRTYTHEPSELTEPVDGDVPRLAQQFDVDDSEVQRIKGKLINRSKGRDSDAEKLIRHSLAAHNLRTDTYRSAFKKHCGQIDEDIPEYAGDYPLSPSEYSEHFSKKSIEGRNERHRDSQLRKRRERKMGDVDSFISVFLDSEGPFGTKVDAIIAVNAFSILSRQRDFGGIRLLTG